VFRSVVEPAAAELAASRSLADADRVALAGHLTEVASAAPSARRLADSRLHLAIAELSGSPSLAAAVAQVQGRLDELLASIPVLDRNIAHSDAQHARIVRAILARNPRRAREAMLEHVEGTAALLRGFLG
jgi:DNA-binding FadR family transcriptional regulator